MKKTDKRIVWMDSLRGLACLIVVFAHIVATDPQIGMYANGCGKIGVWLFMLLSGMMAERSVVSRGKEISLLDVATYYEKKFVRIYPALLVALLVTVFGFRIIGSESAKGVLLLREGPSHLWYIPALIKFYLVVPLLMVVNWLCNRWLRHPEVIFYGIIACLTVGFALLFPYTRYQENSIALYWYMPVFLGGMLLAPIIFKKGGKRQRVADLAAVLGILLILVQTPLSRELIWNVPPSGYLQNRYLFVGGCWILVFLGAAFGKYTKKGLSRCRVLPWVARFSYELYLFHYFLLLFLWHSCPWATWLRGIVSIIGACALAIVTNKALDLLSRKSSLHVKTGVWVALCVVFIVCF